MQGKNEKVFSQKERVCIALGNEGNGLSDTILKMADDVFSIPFNGQAVESLNVAAAGAVCLYIVNKSMHSKP
jgi:TrmH family RNA methyltransferase